MIYSCYGFLGVIVMWVFLITVSVMLPMAGPARTYTVQSEAVYQTAEDCQTGIQELTQLVAGGLPRGARLRVKGACSQAEDV